MGRGMAAIGYARVSTTDQDLALQLDALAKAGCTRVFEDRASGAKTDRRRWHSCARAIFSRCRNSIASAARCRT